MDHRLEISPIVQVELVRSLFATLAPSMIMSVGFIVSAGVVYLQAQDFVSLILWAAGTATSFARLAFLFSTAAEARSEALTLERARELEKRFAFFFCAFAIALGMFTAHAVMLTDAGSNMLAACLAIGFAAGTATNVGHRPKIAIPAMWIAVAPSALLIALRGDAVAATTAAMLVAFLIGAILSLVQRVQATRKSIGQRVIFASMARQDHLTALPNRLALREWYNDHVSGQHQGHLAVHCIDLNGFKPINDRFGHPAGDELLRAVATRLARNLRPGDIAARLGGDEFAILQRGLKHPDEARLLAHRIAATIREPYRIADQEVRVSASIGYVVESGGGRDLDQLINQADEALYVAKKNGGKVIRFEARDDPARRAA